MKIFVLALLLTPYLGISQTNEFEESIANLHKNNFKDSFDKWEVLNSLSRNSYSGQNPLSNRIEYLREGILILESLDSLSTLMVAYNDLGQLYWISGEPEKSITSVYKVAELAKKLSDSEWEANSYANIATSYKTLKDFKNALSFEKRALDLYQNNVDSLQLFVIFCNMTETYYKLKMYDSAMYSSRKALSFNNSPSYPTNIFVLAYLKGTLAHLVAREGHYDSAKTLISESASLLSSYQDFSLNQYLSLCQVELGQIFLDNRKFNDAIQYAKDGYVIGTKNDLREVIRDGSQVLSKAYEAQKDFETSLFYRKEYHAFNDSITNVENVKQIESLRADFEINQKQTELDIVEVQRKNQELVSYITAGILLVILVLAIIVYRSYRQKNALSKKLALINESKNKLFSIISHDLRGPMAAFSGVGFMIKSAMESNDKSFLEEVATEVDKSSKQLSSLLENLLSWAMQEQDGLSVHQEKINVKEVFEELKDTFEGQAKIKNIKIKIEDVQAFDVNADKNMTFTIFRNLISNALKFTPENGEIKVLSSLESERAKIEVHDTGVGMSHEKVNSIFEFDSNKSTYGTSGEKGLGLGLQLVSEFVEINNGTIEVESKEGSGTAFIVKLPLFKQDKG